MLTFEPLITSWSGALSWAQQVTCPPLKQGLDSAPCTFWKELLGYCYFKGEWMAEACIVDALSVNSVRPLLAQGGQTGLGLRPHLGAAPPQPHTCMPAQSSSRWGASWGAFCCCVKVPHRLGQVQAPRGGSSAALCLRCQSGRSFFGLVLHGSVCKSSILCHFPEIETLLPI